GRHDYTNRARPASGQASSDGASPVAGYLRDAVNLLPRFDFHQGTVAEGARYGRIRNVGQARDVPDRNHFPRRIQNRRNSVGPSMLASAPAVENGPRLLRFAAAPSGLSLRMGQRSEAGFSVNPPDEFFHVVHSHLDGTFGF